MVGGVTDLLASTARTEPRSLQEGTVFAAPPMVVDPMPAVDGRADHLGAVEGGHSRVTSHLNGSEIWATHLDVMSEQKIGITSCVADQMTCVWS